MRSSFDLTASFLSTFDINILYPSHGTGTGTGSGNGTKNKSVPVPRRSLVIKRDIKSNDA